MGNTSRQLPEAGQLLILDEYRLGGTQFLECLFGLRACQRLFRAGRLEELHGPGVANGTRDLGGDQLEQLGGLGRKYRRLRRLGHEHGH